MERWLTPSINALTPPSAIGAAGYNLRTQVFVVLLAMDIANRKQLVPVLHLPDTDQWNHCKLDTPRNIWLNIPISFLACVRYLSENHKLWRDVARPAAQAWGR